MTEEPVLEDEAGAPSAICGMKLAVVIPAYNEAATIANVALRASRVCERVIVVDDGSQDGTAERLQGLNVTVLRNDNNRGKATSIWRGAQHALAGSADAVVTLDGDGQHRPEDIPRLAKAAHGRPQSIVIGARLRNRASTPPLRLFGNRCADFWISWAAGHPICDSQSGFRLYPAPVFRFCRRPEGRREGFVFESEVLIDAVRGGYYTLPVEIEAVYPAGNRASHYRPIRDTLLIIRMVAWKLIGYGLYPQGLLRSLGMLPKQS
jgi:glycosyltransferase involved in cell wall biosynthesis